MVPDQNLYAMPEFWETYREQFRAQQRNMPVFSKAPRILRESVIFPYLAGADFLRWWYGSENRGHPAVRRRGCRCPPSRSSIPYRYGRGRSADHPPLHGGGAARAVRGRDGGVRPAGPRRRTREGGHQRGNPDAAGPGLGRRPVPGVRDAGGAAMVWYIVWDDGASRTRFLGTTGQRLELRRRLGYRMELDNPIDRRQPATRIVIAPNDWLGWKQLADGGGSALGRPPQWSAGAAVPSRPLGQHRRHGPGRAGGDLQHRADEIETQPEFVVRQATVRCGSRHRGRGRRPRRARRRRARRSRPGCRLTGRGGVEEDSQAAPGLRVAWILAAVPRHAVPRSTRPAAFRRRCPPQRGPLAPGPAVPPGQLAGMG